MGHRVSQSAWFISKITKRISIKFVTGEVSTKNFCENLMLFFAGPL